MKKYYNPEIVVEMIEVEDILTLSTIGDNVKGMDFGAFENVEA